MNRPFLVDVIGPVRFRKCPIEHDQLGRGDATGETEPSLVSCPSEWSKRLAGDRLASAVAFINSVDDEIAVAELFKGNPGHVVSLPQMAKVSNVRAPRRSRVFAPDDYDDA